MPFQRPHLPWKLPAGDLSLGGRTLLMGVIDGSHAKWPGRPDPGECLARAIELVEQGADLLDFTVLPEMPHGKRIDSNDERARLVPALRKIIPRVDVPVAVTTYNAATAERVAGLGVAVIRDPSGVALDPEMPRVVNKSDAALVLGHAPGPPEKWKKARPVIRLLDAVLGDLDSAIARARRGGVDRRRVAVDPGLGLAKSGPQCLRIVERLRELTKLGQPVMVSPSRQLFLTSSIRASESAWRAAEAAIIGLAVRGGAHIVRTVYLDAALAAAYAGDRLLDALEEPA